MEVTLRIVSRLMYLAILLLLLLGAWYGYSIEIGKPGQPVHIKLEQYPIKRLFK